MSQRKSGLLALILFTLTCILHFLHYNNIISLPQAVLITSRWAVVAVLIVLANLAADAVAMAVDPRLRAAAASGAAR